MSTILLEIPEAQLVEWVRRLPPASKQAVLSALIPDLNDLEALVSYGSQRMRELCAAQGLEWDRLTEAEREQLVDTWVHEA